MVTETAKIYVKEAVLIEDWVGDNADERRESGDSPDKVYTSERWVDLQGNEVTDPEVISRLEAYGSHDRSAK